MGAQALAGQLGRLAGVTVQQQAVQAAARVCEAYSL